MSIVGYQYNAEHYCEEHMGEIAKSTLKSNYPTWSFPENDTETILEIWAGAENINRSDEHSYDSAIFPKVILDSHEAGDYPDVCGKCGCLIETSWHGGTVDHVVAMLKDYVLAYLNRQEGMTADGERMDEFRDRLDCCFVSDYDTTIMILYETVREAQNA